MAPVSAQGKNELIRIQAHRLITVRAYALPAPKDCGVRLSLHPVTAPACPLGQVGHGIAPRPARTVPGQKREPPALRQPTRSIALQAVVFHLRPLAPRAHRHLSAATK